MKISVKSISDFPRPVGLRMPRFLLVALSVHLLIVGCATTLPEDYERTHSTALAQPEDTSLGRFFQADIDAHPDLSGVDLVDTSEWGFRGRVGLANMAEKTLDVQYYIWEVDTIGKILAERLLRAADRGVRVRMLLDHINTADTDFKFARMDFHPNIEVRLFNPFLNREARTLEFLFSLSRLNHRMHNKALIADNTVAIVGGRNIGDDYFGVHTVANFRDLDVAMVGPVVHEISRSFDEYWNSEWAIPASVLIDEELSQHEFQTRKAKLYDWVENLEGFPYTIDKTSDLVWELEELRNDLVWAKATALYDPPDKVETDEEEVAIELRIEAQEQDHEMLFENAYFIAGERGVEMAGLYKERGVRIRMLTNSLATNDVAAAHAGYAKYREDLIRNGVELYELRPHPGSISKDWSLIAGTSKASLHTKAIVMDRDKVFIGSFNMDPRSTAINTEMVILIESPEFAAQVVDYMETGILPENSYRLALEPKEHVDGERLVWITEEDGKVVKYYSEPKVSLWRRFNTWLISVLPIEKQL